MTWIILNSDNTVVADRDEEPTSLPTGFTSVEYTAFRGRDIGGTYSAGPPAVITRPNKKARRIEELLREANETTQFALGHVGAFQNNWVARSRSGATFSQRDSAEAVSRESIAATHQWIIHTAAAMLSLIQGYKDGTRSYSDARLAVTAYTNWFGRKERLFTWYGVVILNEDKREAWANFSTRTGSAIYIDILTATGVVREVDGEHRVSLTNAFFVAGFDVENLALAA